MKNNGNIEKYHLIKRVLEVIYLRYKNNMSDPENGAINAFFRPIPISKSRREREQTI